MAVDTSAEAQGLYLSGSFLAVKPGKPWETKDGTERDPFVVSVLAGERVYQVEYQDEASAVAAVAETERGEPVSLRVFARAKGKDWLAWSGPTLREARG